MNLKKKIKAFFSFKRRSDGGFTLVELIVVIAILAILAGVGTAGYSGYIKNANKNADKALVGNIMRAIETGTNSTMFAEHDSFIKGAHTFPVGVIVLTANGCDVMASSSSITSSNSTCELATVTNYVPSGAYSIGERITIERPLIGSDFYNLYTVDESQITSVTYCKSHTNLKEREVLIGYEIDNCGNYANPTFKKYVFEDDCTGVYELKTDHTEGGTLSKEEIVANSENRVVSTTNSPIYNSIRAAFGEDLSGLSLKYEGWGSVDEEGHTYATLLTYTATMMEDIKGTADKLIAAVEVAKLAGKDINEYLSDNYENAADMMDSFAGHMVKTYTDKTAWMTIWEAADTGDTAYDFGIGANRDFCYAARIAYNTSFASYCSVNGIEQKYSDVIKNYYHSAVSGAIQVPDVVNTAAFSTKEDKLTHGDGSQTESLYSQFKAAGGDYDAAFDQCNELYKIYKDSEACTKNGEALYDVLVTMSQTGDEAYKEGGSDAYFDYYKNLMNENAAYYEYIKNYDGSGIIILATVEEGTVKCEVSPSTANPRNDT